MTKRIDVIVYWGFTLWAAFANAQSFDRLLAPRDYQRGTSQAYRDGARDAAQATRVLRANGDYRALRDQVVQKYGNDFGDSLRPIDAARPDRYEQYKYPVAGDRQLTPQQVRDRARFEELRRIENRYGAPYPPNRQLRDEAPYRNEALYRNETRYGSERSYGSGAPQSSQGGCRGGNCQGGGHIHPIGYNEYGRSGSGCGGYDGAGYDRGNGWSDIGRRGPVGPGYRGAGYGGPEYGPRNQWAGYDALRHDVARVPYDRPYRSAPQKDYRDYRPKVDGDGNYVSDNLFGEPRIFNPDQPVRNLFRYMFP